MKLYCPECKTSFEGDESLVVCPEDGSRLFTLEVDQHDPLLGATIDHRFKVERLLGQGGMGAVYEGVQLSVGRKVAIKVLRTELLDREIALERFYRESKIISELSHPNIVRLIDFGQDRERDLLYLVMELVDGLNFGDVLESGRMRISLALELAYQVCGALTEPHARGVIHRDLKPDNLLIVPISDGTLQVKVLDFGIARALETNTQLTATGMVCGTPQYMAPEQAQNAELGPPTDLYALGIMLFEMLCGAAPFTGQSSLQVMLKQIQTSPPPFADFLPPSALPEEVEHLVKDMLSKSPSGRPQTARDVRDRIDAIRRTYHIESVRIDPDLPRELMLQHLILEAMPSSGGELGQTEAFRRETGLNAKQKASTHTTDEHNLALAETGLHDDFSSRTRPVSDAARVEIMADAARAPHASSHGAGSPPAAGIAGDALFNLSPPTQPPLSSPERTYRSEVDTDTRQHIAAGAGKKNGGLMAVLGVILMGILLAGGVAVGLVVNNLFSTQELTTADTVAWESDPVSEPVIAAEPDTQTAAPVKPEDPLVVPTALEPAVVTQPEPPELKPVVTQPAEKKPVKKIAPKKADKKEEKQPVVVKEDRPVLTTPPVKTAEPKKDPKLKLDKKEDTKLPSLFGGPRPKRNDKERLKSLFGEKEKDDE